MVEPTEADREWARKIMGFRPGQTQFGGWDLDRLRAIAQVLADERERARAPFVAICAAYQTDALYDHYAGHTTAEDILSDVRRAAEETGQ